MKTNYLYVVVLMSFLNSCTEAPKVKVEAKIADPPKLEKFVAPNPDAGEPVLAAKKILVNFNSFWDYYSRNIKLFEDFEAMDENGTTISKGQFLKALQTGAYFPLLLHPVQSGILYQLSKLPAKADKSISAYMKQFATEEIAFFQMEGKPIPSFNFTDLNGKSYTSANTKGKILLFKCWFITCTNCIREMPALNKLVTRLKDRNDILFISLAIDQQQELQQFLTTTKFDYATIPNQEHYMSNKLHVSGYPTHFIIDKKGNMLKAMTEESEMEAYLEKLL